MERRQAMLEAGEEQGNAHKALASELEEPEVDFVALSDTSRKLLNTALFVTGIFGLWMIWAEVLPALHIFNEVTLWHQTLIVNGEQQLKPVTLANLGLALIYLGATIILARQLPAVLEIILLHNTGMSASGRYTVTTLTNYVIFSIGILIIFNTMGTDWSKLQWLVAALGVGIGFGLQEIVANFISGIIILFERPVRVGDVVSVGDTDGIVTRIRIRATTIRNWDGKELLVPNKEFITGRLLNWSLSDPTTRLLIRVGIAYGANVPQAMDLLERVAKENDDVLDEPTPSVIFESFGDNSLNLILRCFVEEVDQRLRVVSNLNQAINERFNEAGIVIAFPQRDLHFDTSEPLRISIEDARVGKG
jgi:potassium efflux system protein